MNQSNEQTYIKELLGKIRELELVIKYDCWILWEMGGGVDFCVWRNLEFDVDEQKVLTVKFQKRSTDLDRELTYVFLSSFQCGKNWCIMYY